MPIYSPSSGPASRNIGLREPWDNRPVATDVTSVNFGVTPDAGTYNLSYANFTNAYPAHWPADSEEGLTFFLTGGAYAGNYGSETAQPRTIRVMFNGDKFCWAQGASVPVAGQNYGAMIYVDGRPTSLTPYTLPANAAFNTVIFPSAKTRLIEIRSAVAISGLFVPKPYHMWKPEPRTGPRVLIMGDSYSLGYGAANMMNGTYWNISPMIGTDDLWLDTIGGTGYGWANAQGGNRYLDRIQRNVAGKTWSIKNINPSMLVVHGGGANDMYNGRTPAQVASDAVEFFSTLRSQLPRTKFVFVEGFAPPGFGPSTMNPKYIEVRERVQEALVGVGVYYIDVATTAPWINGSGRVGAPAGDGGNADIYVGTDDVHLNDAGYIYLRGRFAPKLRRIAADEGGLVNELI